MAQGKSTGPEDWVWKTRERDGAVGRKELKMMLWFWACVFQHVLLQIMERSIGSEQFCGAVMCSFWTFFVELWGLLGGGTSWSVVWLFHSREISWSVCAVCWKILCLLKNVRTGLGPVTRSHTFGGDPLSAGYRTKMLPVPYMVGVVFFFHIFKSKKVPFWLEIYMVSNIKKYKMLSLRKSPTETEWHWFTFSCSSL